MKLDTLIVISLSNYVPPTKGWGGVHIVFATDPVGVDVGAKLLVRSVT